MSSGRRKLSHWADDTIITSLLGQNDVATLLLRRVPTGMEHTLFVKGRFDGMHCASVPMKQIEMICVYL